MASTEEKERRRYALLQAAATIYAEVCDRMDLEWAVDRAVNLLGRVELKTDLSYFVKAGGKAGRTKAEILDHFGDDRGNTMIDSIKAADQSRTDEVPLAMRWPHDVTR